MSIVMPAGRADLWGLLERFLQELHQADSVQGQLRLTLEMVQSAIQADVVLLYYASSHRVAEWVGPDRLDAGTLAEAARKLTERASASESELLGPAWLDLDPRMTRDARVGIKGHAAPASAAALRLSRSRGVWVVALRRDGAAPFTAEDLKLMSLARRLVQQQQSQQAAQDQLRQILFDLVRCLTAALDARDPYTCGHSERVARIAVLLAGRLGQSEAQRSELYLGGLLHDIGKIGVPDAVLQKAGQLSDEEFDQIKQHVVVGDAILSHVRQLAHLRPVIRNHHERFDGTGYPDGLRGEQIPLAARIAAVADSCDAMMSNRPYRRALPVARIEAILSEGAGRQWDPLIVEAFLACRREAFSICERGLGESVLLAVGHALSGHEGPSGTIGRFVQRSSPQGVALRPADAETS